MPPSDLDSVRRRPGMYVGDTRDGSALLCMTWEVVSNALDQHLAGHCTQIRLELLPDGAITVDDDGLGFPLHDCNGVSFAEMALTTLHGTATLDGHAPHEHVGLRGIGLFPVCALSSSLQLDVFREGRHFSQRFERGVAVSALREIDTANRTGTRLTFVPDSAIFPNTWIDSEPLSRRLREMSYLLPALTLRFTDHREHQLHEPRGLLAYVEVAAPDHDDLALPTFLAAELVGEIRVEVAVKWQRAPGCWIESFANIERTTDGGTHVRGLILGLAEGLRRAAPKACAGRTLKQIENALSRGLTAIVCVRLHDPTYGEPTKSRLLTPEAKAAVMTCVATSFTTFLRTESTLRRRFATAVRTAG
jgi:DNA gyrase subunit B